MQKIVPSCDRSNCTKCNYCALNLLRPHLKPMEGNNSVLSQIQPMLTQFEHQLKQEGVISLTIDGKVRFMTQRAEHLLERYFPPYTPDVLPVPLQFWFQQQVLQLPPNNDVVSLYSPFPKAQAGQQLVINLKPDPIQNQYFLLLREQELPSFSIATLESIGLTKREAEVLFWITRDKSNAGIAKVLGCCEGTVRKHLENIYKKLGVQTRIGAVMAVLEKLGLFQGSWNTGASLHSATRSD